MIFYKYRDQNIHVNILALYLNIDLKINITAVFVNIIEFISAVFKRNIVENTSFPSPSDTFTKTEHRPGQRTSLNTFKRTEISPAWPGSVD